MDLRINCCVSSCVVFACFNKQRWRFSWQERNTVKCAQVHTHAHCTVVLYLFWKRRFPTTASACCERQVYKWFLRRLSFTHFATTSINCKLHLGKVALQTATSALVVGVEYFQRRVFLSFVLTQCNRKTRDAENTQIRHQHNVVASLFSSCALHYIRLSYIACL